MACGACDDQWPNCPACGDWYRPTPCQGTQRECDEVEAERDRWRSDYRKMQAVVVEVLGLEEDQFTSTCLEVYAEEKANLEGQLECAIGDMEKAEAERDRLRDELSSVRKRHAFTIAGLRSIWRIVAEEDRHGTDPTLNAVWKTLRTLASDSTVRGFAQREKRMIRALLDETKG